MQQTTTDASSSSAPTVVQPVPPPDEPSNEERHALKRTYLTLLPHTQLVELCLAFEAYSPLHVKKSLWPTNLAVAVAELQLGPASTSSQAQDTITSGPVVNAPLTSVSSLPDAVTQSSPTGTSAAIDRHLPSLNPNGDATATGDESSSPQQPQTSDEPTSQPEPSTSFTKHSATGLPQGPYPHAPYGYPPTQSLPAYPHTPYYQYPPPSYPHNFPPQPPAPYPHVPFPPSHPPFPPAVPLPRHPHPTGLPSTDHSGMPGSDDLPSYEDMLVEALTDLNESDGSAPKALFTWMGSRYPLHTNFRPSASQALQKAFKRGRLEKGSNGRYRLNASWDGGSTSRRTTRRPQSLVQMALPVPSPPTTSPFTHAPLSQPAARRAQGHNASASTPASVQDKTLPYPTYPYHYPPVAPYPRYGPSGPPPVSKEGPAEQQPATAAPGEAAPVESNAVDEVGEGSDAWEAAQAILKAINFGSLLQATAAKPAAPPVRQPSPPANSVHVGPASDQATASETVTHANASATPIQSLSERDRASLQAQLALLAAQLAEIAEDTLASDLIVTDQDVLSEEGSGTEDDEMEAVDIA